GRLDDLQQPNTLLLFEEQAKKLDVNIGDMLTLSAPLPRGTNNTVHVTLGPIEQHAALLSSCSVFVAASPLGILDQLMPDTTGAIFIYLKHPINLTSVRDAAAPPIQGGDGVREHLRTILEKAGYAIMDPDPRAFFFKFDVVTREEWTGQKLDLT